MEISSNKPEASAELFQGTFQAGPFLLIAPGYVDQKCRDVYSTFRVLEGAGWDRRCVLALTSPARR